MKTRPPTVILDEPCARLHDEVAAFAPVFVFKSTRGFFSSPQLAAEELAGELAAAGLAPPFLFVAASFGGYAALAYADRYADNLAGLVLVDASHPGQEAMALAAIPPDAVDTPAMVRFRTKLQGFGPVWIESCATIGKIEQLGDLPLIVLAAGKPDMPDEFPDDTRVALTRSWHALQRRHAALSTNGHVRIVPEAGHDLVKFAPEAVIAAITEFFAKPQPMMPCGVPA